MSRQPKKVVEAFTATGIQIGKLHLHEFTAATLLIMQKINSPLIGTDKSKMTDMDILNLVFILAHPAQESYRLLVGGKIVFEEAVIKFADEISIKDIQSVGSAINKLFERAMSTAPGSSSTEKKRQRPLRRDPAKRKRPRLAPDAD